MHRLLAMKATDLAELYWLLDMYQRTYEHTESKNAHYLLNDIKNAYEEQASYTQVSSSVPPRLHNPRRAGRKKSYSDRTVEEILRLRASGQSIRTIASHVHCSVGNVHKIINEHNNK